MKVGNCWANIDKKEGSLNSKVNIYFDENDTGANSCLLYTSPSPRDS